MRQHVHSYYYPLYKLQEKENAADEHRRNLAEYRKFLESCDFVKVHLIFFSFLKRCTSVVVVALFLNHFLIISI